MSINNTSKIWILGAAAGIAMTAFAGAALAGERFDVQIRGDFFAGLSGNKEAMLRAMKTTESILAADPKHAEARVWHGAGLLSMAGEHFSTGNIEKGQDYFRRGQAEMDEAVALAPDNLAIRLPRGATLLAAGRAVFEQNQQIGKAMLSKALSDYEYAFERQKEQLSTMGSHPAGELLLGIADANSRLGNIDRASEFFDRIEKLLPGTAYAQRAQIWRASKSLTPSQAACIGCHTRNVE